MINLDKEQSNFINQLNHHGIEYLVIGGKAVSYYAPIRQSIDLDIWVKNAPENAEKLYQILVPIVGTKTKITVENLCLPDKHIILKEFDINVDILTSIEGVEFNEAYSKRELCIVGDNKIPVISKDLLVVAKAHLARPIDIQDIKLLGLPEEQ